MFGRAVNFRVPRWCAVRYSIRALLLIQLIVALSLAIVAYLLHVKQKVEGAKARLENHNATCFVEPRSLRVLDCILPPNVIGIRADTGAMRDEDIGDISQFSSLVLLNLNYNPKITDRGVSQLARLRKLKDVSLIGCAITDDGFLELLSGGDGLERVDVLGTVVSEAAVRKFIAVRPHCDVRCSSGWSKYLRPPAQAESNHP